MTDYSKALAAFDAENSVMSPPPPPPATVTVTAPPTGAPTGGGGGKYDAALKAFDAEEKDVEELRGGFLLPDEFRHAILNGQVPGWQQKAYHFLGNLGAGAWAGIGGGPFDIGGHTIRWPGVNYARGLADLGIGLYQRATDEGPFTMTEGQQEQAVVGWLGARKMPINEENVKLAREQIKTENERARRALALFESQVKPDDDEKTRQQKMFWASEQAGSGGMTDREVSFPHEKTQDVGAWDRMLQNMEDEMNVISNSFIPQHVIDQMPADDQKTMNILGGVARGVGEVWGIGKALKLQNAVTYGGGALSGWLTGMFQDDPDKVRDSAQFGAMAPAMAFSLAQLYVMAKWGARGMLDKAGDGVDRVKQMLGAKSAAQMDTPQVTRSLALLAEEAKKHGKDIPQYIAYISEDPKRAKAFFDSLDWQSKQDMMSLHTGLKNNLDDFIGKALGRDGSARQAVKNVPDKPKTNFEEAGGNLRESWYQSFEDAKKAGNALYANIDSMGHMDAATMKQIVKIADDLAETYKITPGAASSGRRVLEQGAQGGSVGKVSDETLLKADNIIKQANDLSGDAAVALATAKRNRADLDGQIAKNQQALNSLDPNTQQYKNAQLAKKKLDRQFEEVVRAENTAEAAVRDAAKRVDEATATAAEMRKPPLILSALDIKGILSNAKAQHRKMVEGKDKSALGVQIQKLEDILGGTEGLSQSWKAADRNWAENVADVFYEPKIAKFMKRFGDTNAADMAKKLTTGDTVSHYRQLSRAVGSDKATKFYEQALDDGQMIKLYTKLSAADYRPGSQAAAGVGLLREKAYSAFLRKYNDGVGADNPIEVFSNLNHDDIKSLLGRSGTLHPGPRTDFVRSAFFEANVLAAGDDSLQAVKNMLSKKNEAMFNNLYGVTVRRQLQYVADVNDKMKGVEQHMMAQMRQGDTGISPLARKSGEAVNMYWRTYFYPMSQFYALSKTASEAFNMFFLQNKRRKALENLTRDIIDGKPRALAMGADLGEYDANMKKFKHAQTISNAYAMANVMKRFMAYAELERDDEQDIITAQ